MQCYIKSQVHSTPKSTEILESEVKSILLKLKIKNLHQNYTILENKRLDMNTYEYIKNKYVLI